MRLSKFVVLLWLLVVCVLGKKGRNRLRGRRCGCKAILTDINVLIDNKLKSFRDNLLQSTVPIPESTRSKLLDLKLKSLNQEISVVRARYKVTRDSLSQHTLAISNMSRQITRLEHASWNMTSVLADVERYISTKERGHKRTAVTPSVENKQEEDIRGYPKDCDEVYRSGGLRYPGEYYIYVKPDASPSPFKVVCHNANNSGWAVFQNREAGDIDFRRTWQEYKKGFGPLTGDFWLGNDKLNYLTAAGNNMLRIEMGDWRGNRYYAEYTEFSVADEENLYKLHVDGYQGNAGDSLSGAWRSHNGQPFSTRDRDNDKRFYDNCAEHYSGAWWFTDCFESHLNGKYYGKGKHQNYFVRDGIHWKSIHPYSSLKYSIMMTRPRRGSISLATSSTLPTTEQTKSFRRLRRQ